MPERPGQQGGNSGHQPHNTEAEQQIAREAQQNAQNLYYTYASFDAADNAAAQEKTPQSTEDLMRYAADWRVVNRPMQERRVTEWSESNRVPVAQQPAAMRTAAQFASTAPSSSAGAGPQQSRTSGSATTPARDQSPSQGPNKRRKTGGR